MLELMDGCNDSPPLSSTCASVSDGPRLVMTVLVVAGGMMMVGCSDDGDADESGSGVEADGGTPLDARSDVPEDDGDASIPTRGPARVIDTRRVRRRSAVDLEVVDNSADTLTVSLSSTSTTVYKLDVTFAGRGPAGAEWRHRASLLLPKTLNPQQSPRGGFALLQGSTPNPIEEVSQSPAFRLNYAASITARLGIPTMLVSNLPGPVNLREGPSRWQGQAERRCFSTNLPSSRYVPCLLQILRRTDDLEADPFRYIASSWLRAITAASRVSEILDEIEWENGAPPAVSLNRAIILAGGARAVGARMAAGADVRVDGVFGHIGFGALEAWSQSIAERWSNDFGWLTDPEAFRRWLQTDPGRQWRATVDPVEWPGLLEGESFVLATSTNDPRVPLDNINRLASRFPSDTRLLVAGGAEGEYGSGIGSPTHLAGWRGFVAHVYLGAPWNSIAVETEQRGSNVAVEASVRGEATTESVRVAWSKRHSAGDDRDFRDTSWSQTELTARQGLEGAWTGQFAPIVQHYASYTQVYQTVRVPSILETTSRVSITSRWASTITLSN